MKNFLNKAFDWFLIVLFATILFGGGAYVIMHIFF